MAGVAAAEEVRSRFPDADILFFGAGKEVERRCLRGRGFTFLNLNATGWTGSVAGAAMFVLRFAVGLLRSLWAMNRLRPDAVFGLGGYSSLAPVIGAFILRVPVIILEQNVIPGRANRLLSRFADLVLCHWPSASTVSYFRNSQRLRFTGTPLRKELFGCERKEAARLFGLSPDKTTVLVLGGSQGARAINTAVTGCLPELVRRYPDIQFIHCTGRDDYLRVRQSYEALGAKARVYDFLYEMGAAYSMAELAISRAGATMLAELTARGVPAILVPYPYSTDGHQYTNALELSEKGAAMVLEERFLTPHRLLATISMLLDDREKLDRMGLMARAIGRPRASQAVVDVTLKLLEKRKGGRICQDLSPQTN